MKNRAPDSSPPILGSDRPTPKRKRPSTAKSHRTGCYAMGEAFGFARKWAGSPLRSFPLPKGTHGAKRATIRKQSLHIVFKKLELIDIRSRAERAGGRGFPLKSRVFWRAETEPGVSDGSVRFRLCSCQSHASKCALPTDLRSIPDHSVCGGCERSLPSRTQSFLKNGGYCHVAGRMD